MLYQKTLSLDEGLFSAFWPNGYCRFQPHCSEYTKQAIIKHGPVKGVWLGLKRVGRCHPWQEPKIDNIP